MYSIQLSPLAKEGLEKLKEHLETEFDEKLAKEVLRDLILSIKKFEEYPLIGRPLTHLIDIPTEYMYFVVSKNYIFYRLEENTVKIIRILDTRRDFVQILFGKGF